MGEIADALVEGGSMCASCGVYLEWADAPGFPLYCSRQCAPDQGTWMQSLDYMSEAYHTGKIREEPDDEDDDDFDTLTEEEHEAALRDTWFPTMFLHLRSPTPEEVDTPREVLYKSTGHLFMDILEQKWTNALGDEEWRPVPSMDSEEVEIDT